MANCSGCRKRMGVMETKYKLWQGRFCEACSNSFKIDWTVWTVHEHAGIIKARGFPDLNQMLAEMERRKFLKFSYSTANVPEKTFTTGGTPVNSTQYAGGTLLNEQNRIDVDFTHRVIHIIQQHAIGLKPREHFHSFDEIRKCSPVTYYRHGNPVTCYYLNMALYGSGSLQLYLLIDADPQLLDFLQDNITPSPAAQ